ncbi:dCTP deaminase/dUTPase family protein [Anaerovorax odorimutans]|uniref:deoxyuridine 5'-triphosphate nucleotidohydrolase n=1 Tax=Anaerovorax odorimutans TaxID=109327 RepID=UPI0004259F9F|nr:deoxyuridine 5'-triphosphate nucleotidohydrolase [Anaerovorax odorimutans]
MKRIAKFEKTSFNQFQKDIFNLFGDSENVKNIYDGIILPKRATKGSAGYDFFIPFDVSLRPDESIIVPTGIRVKMDQNWVLLCYPRSGLGFKYRLQLDNTVGIIDSDYYYSKNEGHILIKITNNSNEGKEIIIDKNKGFAQGIFMEYGITVDDEVTEIRDGGFGSTNK